MLYAHCRHIGKAAVGSTDSWSIHHLQAFKQPSRNKKAIIEKNIGHDETISRVWPEESKSTMLNLSLNLNLNETIKNQFEKMATASRVVGRNADNRLLLIALFF